MAEKGHRWRRLDNTAKIFPVIANEGMSQVFRISAVMKEEVQPELLQKALEDILPHIREFRVKLRRGLFWYYFEENDRIPQVQRESTYPCRYLDPHGSQRFLFRVTYFKCRINLEVFHALTDGLGCARFLRSLVARYLELVKEEPGVWMPEDEEKPDEQIFETVDSYLENYREMEHRSYSSKPAFRMEGHFLPLGSGQVLHGYLKVAEVKAVAKKHGVTVTKYLASALLWSIWQEYLDGKADRRPVVLNIPINLRAFFQSDTMANFFAVSSIGWLFRDPDMTFDQLVQKISRQMDRKITKERLEESISYNVSNEKKWYLRIIPLVIKRLALGFIFSLKDRAYTMTLSNIGPIRMDPEFAKFADDVERFQVMIGVSRKQPCKCSVCAYGDEMTVTFTSVFADSRIQRRFFRKMKEDGIAVRLEGNELSGARKRDNYPRIRRVWVIQKGGEKRATRMAKKVGHSGEHVAKGLWDYLRGKENWKEELRRRFHV